MATASTAGLRLIVDRLHQSEERFRLLVENVQDCALFMLDPVGRVASWNRGAERIKGYRSEEIVGRHFSRFYTQEDIDSGMPDLALEAAAMTGRHEDEGWRVRKDGTRFWANVVITALRDDAGKLLGFGKVTRDLTERMKAIECLKDSEARLLALTNHGPSLMFIKDLEGRYQYVNDQFCRSVGLARHAVLGRTDRQILSSDQAARREANDASVIAAGAALEFSEAAYCRNSRHMGIVCKFPIRDADGRITALGGVVTDIAERKRIGRESPEKHAREEAAECFAAAVNASGAVEGRAGGRGSSQEEIEAFAQMVSRDLRAPLRHIENLAAEVQEKLAGMNDSARRLSAISQSAVKLGKLTSDLMLFAQADRSSQRHRRVALEPVVMDARSELGSSATSGRVDWKLGRLPAVMGDRALLRVVFVNLLSNALKFTRLRERAFIEIGALPGAEGDHEVVVVRDNGIGFDQRFAQKIFEAFRRVHGAKEFDGAGIGLATAKRIVECHGGRIWAEGAPDAGASFFVALKRAGQPAPSLRSASPRP